jgi:hypothetical protein
VHALGGEHAGGGGAVLAGVEIAGDGDLRGRPGHIGVLKDDHRGLAAQLEVAALERLGGRARERLAGRHAAGDRDHLGDRMTDQRRPGAAVPADDIKHPGGQDVG